MADVDQGRGIHFHCDGVADYLGWVGLLWSGSEKPTMSNAKRSQLSERPAEKQRSREEDQRRLDAGEITPEELRRENGFASSLPLSKFRITHIGKTPIGKMK